MLRTFYGRILLIDILTIIIALIVCAIIEDYTHMASVLIAVLITTANALVAWNLAKSGAKGSLNSFMGKVLGGMGARLGGMLIIILLLFLFTNLPQISFIITLFISYICKSIQEIIFILKLQSNSNH